MILLKRNCNTDVHSNLTRKINTHKHTPIDSTLELVITS